MPSPASPSFLSAAAVATLIAALAPALAAAKPPNIVLIVADDMGWNGVSYHDGFVKTPHIDRIAKQGVELDRFYVSPMCSPTRAGLLTGRYPMRFGMARSVVRPWAKHGLPPAEQTLPESLASAGYKHRGAFGKWHLGHLDPQWHPLSQGFTTYAGCYNGACDYFTRLRDGEIDWHADWADVDPKAYATDEIADRAAAFVKASAASSPFFCYVAFTAPHDPFQAPKKYIDQYAHLDDTPNDGKPSNKQLYSAMIACMDDGIGRILKSIDDAGAKDNTLVWFMSDNGGVRPIADNNGPLRAGKLTVYEGGIRVPAAAWWPGHIEGGRKIDAPVVNVDVAPTLLKAAGAAVKQPAGPLDGRDVLPLLTAKGTAPATDIYAFTGQDGLDREQIAVISTDNWKLVAIGPDLRAAHGPASPNHKVELFNLTADPYEKRDLAKDHPDRVAALWDKAVAFRASEPPDPVLPINRKPSDFTVPTRWNNAPAGQGAKDGK